MVGISWALLLLLVAPRTRGTEAQQARLHVALHAQSRYTRHGWVAGSEITTRGLERAFARHPQVASVKVFAPFSYEGLHATAWDLVVIEGYIGTVPRFIHEVRRVSPGVRVLHYCLDTYPDLALIKALDVDGFLTNSWTLLPELAAIAPTEHVLLAVDSDLMHPVEPVEQYRHGVVYLGQMSTTKEGLVPMLHAVTDLGLAIYGLGWDRFNESAGLLPNWKGVLPVDDIAALYSSAAVVLGTTEEQQRRLGMINNRVFEALSCQAPLVMHPPFPELQQAVGHESGVLYASTAAEVRSHVQRLQQDPALRRRIGESGRRLVVEQHSYDHRVEQIMRFFTRLSTEQPAPMTRPNAPVVVLAYPASSSSSTSDWGLYLSLVPGLLQLERSGLCRLQTVSVSTLADLAMACQTADLTLLRAPLGLPLEAGFRSLTTCKGRKGLLVPWPAEGGSTMAALGENGEEDALLEYSVLGYDQPMPLHRHPNAVWTLGLALALAADRAPSASLPDVTIDISQERGTVARLSWPGSARQEQEMDHVRPETLTSLLGVAARVHLRPGAVGSAAVLGLLGVAVGAEVVVEGGMREAIAEAIGRAQALDAGQEVGGVSGGPLVSRLLEAVSTGLFGLPPRAGIRIEYPAHDDLLLFSTSSSSQDGAGEPGRKPVQVQVSMQGFRMLQDGYWCLHLDGREVTCVGDDVASVSLDLAALMMAQGKNVSSSSSSGLVGGKEEQGVRAPWSDEAELQAVLVAGGLEFPSVQRSSQPVRVRAIV